MSHTMWTHQITALKNEYTTVAYDARGPGNTGSSTPDRYSVDLFASDLNALIEALGIDRTVICGLSMGGTIAQAFAAACPEKLTGLVLADTFPTGPLPLTARLALANIRFLARLDRVVNYKTLNRWQLRIGNWLIPGVWGDETTIQQLVDESHTIPHREFVMIADATALFPKTPLDLSQLTIPTLIMHGEHLPMANEEITNRLVAKLPQSDSTVCVVPGSGHASNLDNPAFFTRVFREFLAERVYADSNNDPDE